jgi:tetratricopeptide (TPR) repeat protein
MGRAIADTFAGDDDSAWGNINKLLNDYPGDRRTVEAIGQVAWSCRKVFDFRNARSLYQHVVERWPDHERAIYSQRGVILASIALKEKEAASAGVARLRETFSDHAEFAKMMSDVAEAYRESRHFAEARELHRYILENREDYDGAIFSQRGVILCSVELEDDPNTQAGIDRLLAEYGNHPKIADVSYQVARRLNYKDPVRAAQLYDRVIWERPDSDIGLFSGMNFGTLKVYAGDLEGGQAIFDEVLAANEGHPLLPKAVALVAEAYFDKGAERRIKKQSGEARMCYQKALVSFYRIMEELPETEYTTAWAHYFAGMCHEMLGEPALALQCYEKLVENWPDFERAWDAQFRVGRIYSDLGKAGKIPKDIADVEARAAYEAVVQDHPECLSAKAAQAWVEHYDRQAEETDKLKTAWEKMIAELPGSELAERGRQWLKENGFVNEGEGL